MNMEDNKKQDLNSSAKIRKKRINENGENSFHGFSLSYLCSMGKNCGQILEKVCKLYQRYGIKSVTMDDVAKHLCISKKTLYENFTDKEDLVTQVMLMEHNRWFGILRGNQSRGPNAIMELFEVYKVLKEMFRHYNPSMEYDLRKYYPDLSLKLREVRRKMIFEAGYRNMTRGKKEGLYRRDLNSRIIAKLHLFKVENMLDSDMFSIGELTSFKVFHEIFVYHMNGIMSPKGRFFFEDNFKTFRDQPDAQPS
jgi:AcrR family transcriptional regulator